MWRTKYRKLTHWIGFLITFCLDYSQYLRCHLILSLTPKDYGNISSRSLGCFSLPGFGLFFGGGCHPNIHWVVDLVKRESSISQGFTRIFPLGVFLFLVFRWLVSGEFLAYTTVTLPFSIGLWATWFTYSKGYCSFTEQPDLFLIISVC